MKVKDCIVGRKVLSTLVMSTFDSFTFTKQSPPLFMDILTSTALMEASSLYTNFMKSSHEILGTHSRYDNWVSFSLNSGALI